MSMNRESPNSETQCESTISSSPDEYYVWRHSRRRFVEASLTAMISGFALRPPPAEAMWQQWTPEDMLSYVDKYGEVGNATSVLAAMDKAAETSWMMNMGPDKAKLVADIIASLKPRKVLEIGTFLGYMAISMACALPEGSQLVTIEKDETNHAAATLILQKALGVDLSNGGRVAVESWLGPSSSVLESAEFRRLHLSGSKEAFDMVLMDHWKPEYAADLKRLERLGFIRKGSVVLADNVLFPGAPELLTYLGVPFEIAVDDVSGQECLSALSATRGDRTLFEAHRWRTSLISVPFEYRPLTPDAISYSVRL